MNRALVVLGLVLPTVPSLAPARTDVETAPRVDEDLVTPAITLVRLASTLELPIIPRGLVDRMIRLRLGMRDLVHHATERLSALAQDVSFTLPDLRILTTEPVGASESTRATSGFGWRDDPLRHRRKFHHGADVRARPGTPVVAAGDGLIVFAGRRGGYGNLIEVDHGGGLVTRYAHLRRIEAREGALILAGQRIAQVGSTGRATGPHLHFEVRLDGRAVDPGTAMIVAELARESVSAGKIAGFALMPEMQALEQSELDPPRSRRSRAKAKGPKGSRPGRPGRAKRIRPVS